MEQNFEGSRRSYALGWERWVSQFPERDQLRELTVNNPIVYQLRRLIEQGENPERALIHIVLNLAKVYNAAIESATLRRLSEVPPIVVVKREGE